MESLALLTDNENSLHVWVMQLRVRCDGILDSIINFTLARMVEVAIAIMFQREW